MKYLSYLYFLVCTNAYADESEFSRIKYSDSKLTPSPACISAAPNGDVYVGVDLLGSLAKGPDKGRIVKLIDNDNDGKADKHTIFAEVDNPRGLIARGDKVYALHSVIPKSNKEEAGIHLSVFTDSDGDGVADGPAKRLIKNISTLKSNQERGGDHCTNGIRMGIDGWIYIAVGDFGFVDAEGTDGTKLTLLGGGVVRVRPDGSEMELYTRGLRNIYDVAVDPFMNIYTRGNTNDGQGWNVRFIHHIQSGFYGYPTHFKYFTDEVIPALADLGGGSGTGAYFLAEPTWPEKYNNTPLMADWGLSQLFIHRVTPHGASFKQSPEKFLSCSQITDVDVDGSGRMYLAAWAGAGYKGSSTKGYIERIVPNDWKYKAFPDLKKTESANLVNYLNSDSAVMRLEAQQVILSRGDKDIANKIIVLAQDERKSDEVRTAAIYTYAQLLEADAIDQLLELVKTNNLVVREQVLRALADRKKVAKELPVDVFLGALKSENPRIQVVAANGLGRIGDVSVANDVLEVIANIKPQKNISAAENKPFLFQSEMVQGKMLQDFDINVDRVKTIYITVKGDAGIEGSLFDPVLIDKAGKAKSLTSIRGIKVVKSGESKSKIVTSAKGAQLVMANKKSAKQGILVSDGAVIRCLVPFELTRLKGKFGINNLAKNNKGGLQFTISLSQPSESKFKEGPHATPNPAVIIPHVGVDALVKLNAIDACLIAVDNPEKRKSALWALQSIHDDRIVAGLISKLENSSDELFQIDVLTALARLYNKEQEYDGSWWWGTQPETRWPYYKPISWGNKTKDIEKVYREKYASASSTTKNILADISTKNRMDLKGISIVEVVDKNAEAKKGEVGRTSIEDVMRTLDKYKGNAIRGEKVYLSKGCIGCHAANSESPIKAPDVFKTKLTKDQLAEAILKPAATIADTWVEVTLKDKMVHMGTLIKDDGKEVVIHNIAGIPSLFNMSEVESVKKQTSTLMNPEITHDLSLQQFTDLVEFLYNK